MKRKYSKYIIVGIFSVAVILLLIINATVNCSDFWTVKISDGINMFILIYVSFYLVQYQQGINHKKDNINNLIYKIQSKVSELSTFSTNTDNDKKITRFKFSTITNLIAILTEELPNETLLTSSVMQHIDTLNNLLMDHIDDQAYIEKSYAQILQQLSHIDTKLEQIRFKL